MNNNNNILNNIGTENVNYNQVLIDIVNETFNSLVETQGLNNILNTLDMQIHNVRNINDFINFYAWLHNVIFANNNEQNFVHGIIRNIDHSFLNRARLIHQMIDNINNNINHNNNINNNSNNRVNNNIN
jgi:hypothetical protein